MNDVFVVRFGDRMADLIGDGGGGGGSEAGRAGEDGVERGAAQQLHRDVEVAASRRARGEDARDVRAGQAGGGFGFDLEAADEVGLHRSAVGVEDLDGCSGAGGIDDAHGALADKVDDGPLADLRSDEGVVAQRSAVVGAAVHVARVA